MQFVDLGKTAEHFVLLKMFYEALFTPGFPDPDERESLPTLQQNLVNVAAGTYGLNNYHIVLGLDERQRPVAACIADYLYESNCGAIEYILVDEARRGEGLGRAIHEHTERILLEDARRVGRDNIEAMMIEINDPYRAPPELDNADPFDRLLMWHKWGYQRLRFPYEQPALSEEQAAIDYLLLGVSVRNPGLTNGFPSALACQLVTDYLVWANRFDAFDTDPFYRAMADYAARVPLAPLQRLDAYIGREPGGALQPIPIIAPDTPAFANVMELYQRVFSAGPTTVEPARFRSRLTTPRTDDALYHLWGFSESAEGPVVGMTSFFSMPRCGFLGYLALEPGRRGKGLAPSALRRIEEQMFRDRSDITRYYTECDIGSSQEAAFIAMGFTRVDRDYRQPALRSGEGSGVPMSLLVRLLGDPVLPSQPSNAEITDDLEKVEKVIYSGQS